MNTIIQNENFTDWKVVINDEYIDLKEINNIIKCEYIEPRGFPKGRRNLHESDFDCAKRIWGGNRVIKRRIQNNQETTFASFLELIIMKIPPHLLH